MTKKELIREIDQLCEKANQEDSKFNHIYEANRWQKGNRDRLYINRTNGRNEKSMGYIDLENLDFSNLKVPAGTMYNGIEKIKEVV